MKSKMKLKVLVVEDDVELGESLCVALKQCGGVTARHAPTAEVAIQRCLREDTYHIVLCDLNLPGDTGLTLINKLHEACPATYSVLLTGQGTPGSVAAAFKRGAVEFLPKPVRMRDLQRLCDHVKTIAPLFLPNHLLREPRGWLEFEGLVSREPPMLIAFDGIRELAPMRRPVLMVGEIGTGKTSLAQALHRRSHASAGPFVAIRTAAYPPRRLPRVLFGRERDVLDPRPKSDASLLGAVERAQGGTLYIDELTALDSHTQARLVTLIETGCFQRVDSNAERRAELRLVVSSPVELEPLVAKGKVNPELYMLLNGGTVRVPPLRERPRDIPLIVSRVMRQLIERRESRVSRLSAEAERLLSNYPWPGNVRELESVIQLSVFGCRNAALQPDHLPSAVRGGTSTGPAQLHIPFGIKLEDAEREVILQTLRLSNGNKSQTADMLGISRRSLYDKLQQYRKQLGINLLEEKQDFCSGGS